MSGEEYGAGWMPFGTHAAMRAVRLRFSEEVDEDGHPLWEQAVLGPNEWEIIVVTRYGGLLPQIVGGRNIGEALDAVKAVPFADWFPSEDETE